MRKTALLIILCLGFFNQTYAQGAAELVALTNVNIIDVENSSQMDNMTILIEDNRIKSIQSSETANLNNIGKVIDLKGSFVIPGLIDAHVHLFRPKNRDEILTKLLFSGVTTVRDMGGDARMYQALKQRITSGDLQGPDIYYSANVFGPLFLKDPRTKFAALGLEPGSAPWMRTVTEETNLEAVVNEAKEAGVTGLKVYSNVAPELLTKLTAAAHLGGLKMWSHASIFPSKPSDAVDAGVDVLSHSIGMIFELESNLPMSFNEAIRKSVPLQDFKNTDASAPALLSLFKNMHSKNIIFEPTLSAWSLKLRTPKPNNPSAQKSNPTKHLSTAASKMDFAAMDSWAKRITRAAYQNGVTIAAGTDFNANIKWVQDEIILLTESGLTNMDALKAATINNARVIGIENSHGSITEGKIANLVVLSENPLENIEGVRSVVAVFKNGKEYKSED